MTNSLFRGSDDNYVLDESDLSEYSHEREDRLSVSDRLGAFGVFLILSMYILPFLFGGRDALVQSGIKFILFALCFYSLFLMYARYARVDTLSKKVKISDFKLIAPLFIILSIQIIPLPLSIVEFLSPEVALSYAKAGAVYGYLSIDVGNSISSFTWFFLLSVCVVFCLHVPYTVMKVGQRVRSDKQKTLLLAPQAREYDFLSEVLQKTVVRVSLICACIGISHLAFRSNKFFGFFEVFDDYISSSRAHWPFANANQLAVILEIGLVLSFSRFLRNRYLSQLSVSSVSKEETIGKMCLNFIFSIEKQSRDLSIIFVLALALILTMSRAGLILSYASMSVLWVYYLLHPVQVLSLDKRRRDVKVKKISLIQISAVIIVPFLCLLGLLSFLGAEATSHLSGRVIETYEQAGSAPRWEINAVTLEVFKNNMLFGIGLNCWSYFAPQYASDYLAGWKLDYAHNDIFQLISEIGIVGGIACSLPIMYFILHVFKGISTQAIVVQKFHTVSLLVVFMIPVLHSLVDFPFHLPLLSIATISMLVSLLRAVRR